MKKPLYIPPKEGVTGLKVYCKKCRKDVYGVCKETSKAIDTCKFGDKHIFRVIAHVPGTKHDIKKKNLETRSLNEAKKEAIDFIADMKEGHTQGVAIPESSFFKPIVSNTGIYDKPFLLKDAVFKYISFLNDEGVEDYNKENRGRKHLVDLRNELLFLLKVLTDNGYNLTKLPVTQFSDRNIIGLVYSSLKKNYFPRTLQKRFSLYRAFELWLHTGLKYPLSVSWKEVPIDGPRYEPKSISNQEYYTLLKVITPENGMGELIKDGKITQKNYFKPWLIVAIKLALETGCRREELIRMKFEDIIEVYGEKPYLRVENLKVNRINGFNTPENKVYIPIPISRGLVELLKELGINEYKGTDRHILAPEKLENRNVIMDYLTRAFPHFYKLVNPKAELKFKNLRKTNLTYKRVLKSYNNTTHSTDGVLEKHYEDKVVIARSLFGYELFPIELEQKEHVNYWV